MGFQAQDFRQLREWPGAWAGQRLGLTRAWETAEPPHHNHAHAADTLLSLTVLRQSQRWLNGRTHCAFG